MNYKNTLDYLYKQLPMFHRIGAAAYKADLNNTIAICDLLGNPEKKFKSIHIAGTNGKGSSSHMLAAVLQQAGYKTGLYTSPHLKDFRERIKIDGKKIPKKYVTGFVKRHKKELENIQPSFFEWTVGLCFDYFAKKKVDIAIIEVGLGGRLDSTNVIVPLASLITNIGIDHADLLGNTIQKIAKEKAGIIKPGIPVIISQSQKETKNIFLQKAKQTKSKIFFADKIFIHENAVYHPEKSSTTYTFTHKRKKINISADLPGTYQKQNIAGVMMTLEVVKKQIPVSDKTILKALKNVKKLTGLHGRWELLNKEPRIICDTGHNADGIKEVIRSVDREFDSGIVKGTLHVVFGAVNDKDLSKIFMLLKKNAHFSKAKYYFCRPAIPRGMDTETLTAAALKYGLKGKKFESVKMALAAAKSNAKPHELVFVGGSTFTVAEIV